MKIATNYIKAPGSWLLRFSSSEKECLAFTVVESDERVMHYRVSREWSTFDAGARRERL